MNEPSNIEPLRSMLATAFPSASVAIPKASLFTLLAFALCLKIHQLDSICRFATDPRFAGMRPAWGFTKPTGPHSSTLYKLAHTADFTQFEYILRQWSERQGIIIPIDAHPVGWLARFPGLARVAGLIAALSEDEQSHLAWKILEEGGYHMVAKATHLTRIK